MLQFSVKHEQTLDCGGGYIKLVPATSGDQMASFGGNTPYSLMFGPDICGMGTRKVHVIITHKETNYLIKKEIPAKTDDLTHVYTLVIKSDNTYQVRPQAHALRCAALASAHRACLCLHVRMAAYAARSAPASVHSATHHH